MKPDSQRTGEGETTFERDIDDDEISEEMNDRDAGEMNDRDASEMNDRDAEDNYSQDNHEEVK